MQWKDFEYSYKPKSTEWFWYVASGSLVLIIIAILLRNFLLGVFAIITGLVITLSGVKKPQKINFSIEEKGVSIGNQLYPYDELESFWIDELPDKKELILISKKKLMGALKLPLTKTDPDLVKERLLTFLKEKEHEETFTEAIADKLGF